MNTCTRLGVLCIKEGRERLNLEISSKAMVVESMFDSNLLVEKVMIRLLDSLRQRELFFIILVL